MAVPKPVTASTDDYTIADNTTYDIGDNKTVEDDITYYQNRVFINHLDRFHGAEIAKILADKFFRDTEEEIGEGVEEEAEEVPPGLGTPLFDVKKKYQIVGTARNKRYEGTEDVSIVIPEESEENFIKEVMKCGFVVYDITIDENEIPKAAATLQAIEKKLEELKEQAPKKFASMKEERVFVLISTIMTWAKTRPVDPEDPDTPFVETDFRKRKPHPNYRAHIDLEKEVIQKGKKMRPHLITYVIASGITYGEKEEDLHQIFKMAWQCKLDLPIMQNGHNTIPLINVKDLVSVLFGVLEKTPKKPKYILAVEQTPCTQKQIMKTLSKLLGTNRVRYITKEDMFLYPDIEQVTQERLSVGLKMEPNSIVSELEIPWTSDANFCENIEKIIKEYKESRKLYPINIIVHGPPAVGKTLLAKKLAEHYKIPHLSPQKLIENTLANLRVDIEYARQQINRKAVEDEENEDEENVVEEEDDEDWDEKLGEWTKRLKEIERGLEESENKKLPDHLLIQLFKEKLKSNECQNHGYVLEGYPKTSEQTKILFNVEGDDIGEEAEEEEEGEDEEGLKKYILPHFVITLEASDEFLCERVMHMPESEVQGTHYTEEHMARRLEEFRRNNTDEMTLLNIFDEREIHPYAINAETDDINTIYDLVTQRIGPPTAFELTFWEQEQKRLEEEELQRLELEKAQKLKEEKEKLAEEEHYRNMELWAALLQQLQHEEQQQLTAQCKPLREYLIRFVFPTLTRGLLETARLKPCDPVDFLAEYLFKENPEGRMFDPAFVAAADDLFKTIEDFQKRLGD